MDSHSPKLSLDLSPPWLHAGERIKEPDKPHNYVSRLQHELTKIESFKRELPLSFHLLTDAVGRLKKEGEEVALADCDLDESPLENTGAVDGDKKAWMSSAQLWSSDITPRFRSHGREKKMDIPVNILELDGHYRHLREFWNFPGKERAGSHWTGLSLQVKPEPVTGLMRGTGAGGGARFTSLPVFADQIKLSAPPVSSELQGPKKERRCWSPELHRRFVNALDKLGGSQVATPKQIRELMQVSDLTNDEVKSHLQKYRLHIKKLRSSSTSLLKDKLFASYGPQREDCGGGGACGTSPMKAEKQAILVPRRDPFT